MGIREGADPDDVRLTESLAPRVKRGSETSRAPRMNDNREDSIRVTRCCSLASGDIDL
jgi:hypothetical protein